MAFYRLVIEARAEKELRKLNPQVRRRISLAIDKLAENPEPPAARKMVGSDGFRLRIGDYRVIYRIFNKVLEVYVIDLGHRREIYKTRS